MCEMPGVYSWIPYESNIEAVDDSINSFLFETQVFKQFLRAADKQHDYSPGTFSDEHKSHKSHALVLCNAQDLAICTISIAIFTERSIIARSL